MDDPIIETAGIAALTDARLLDVRDEELFAKGHAEGAVRVPVERWIAAARGSERSFDDHAYWGSELAALGLRQDETAVIYDNGQMTEAARVWFILQYFGARAVVVNGGWPALQQSGSAPRPPLSARLPFSPVPGAGPIGLVSRTELRDGLGVSAVLDARTRAEYEGEDLRNNNRGGHLPGARLVPHADLLTRGFLKPAEELKDLMTGAQFQPGDHIVTHCDGGGRAALAAIAAMRAGFRDVDVYYLSFSDWAKDESCPVVRPK